MQVGGGGGVGRRSLAVSSQHRKHSLYPRLESGGQGRREPAARRHSRCTPGQNCLVYSETHLGGPAVSLVYGRGAVGGLWALAVPRQ